MYGSSEPYALYVYPFNHPVNLPGLHTTQERPLAKLGRHIHPIPSRGDAPQVHLENVKFVAIDLPRKTRLR